MSLVNPKILYNLDEIATCIDRFSDIFGSRPGPERRPRLFHSFKANTFAPLLSWLKGLGFGASVSNIHEFRLATQLGFEQICATSPALEAEAMAAMVHAGVEIYLSSYAQLAAFPKGTEVGLRMQVTKSGSAWPSRFGFDARDTALDDLVRHNRLRVTALLFHHRNIETPGELRAHVLHAYEVSRRFKDVRSINLGGGMTALANDHAAWREGWQAALAEVGDRNWTGKLAFEPGAQHLSAAGYLVCAVLDSAVDRQRMQNAVLNASHWCLKGWSPIRPICPDGAIRTSLFGSTCYEDDVWVRNQPMGALAAGDIIAFGNMGAYVSSMARRFCHSPLPEERVFRYEPPVSLEALRAVSRDGAGVPTPRG